MVDTTPPGKLTAAMVLGIAGGVLGILGALLAIRATIVGLGFVAVFLGVLGIVGGSLARSRPVTAALLQLVSGVAGFFAVSTAWLMGGPLLLIGAILAWIGRSQKGAAAEEFST